jgi:hypothetical protein
MLPASMLKAPVCPTPIGCFTDNVEERFFILLIPPAITPDETGGMCLDLFIARQFHIHPRMEPPLYAASIPTAFEPLRRAAA